MQTLNKSLVKNTLTYTWFIYPVAGILLTLIWLWSFPTFHQPSAHQRISAFFATEIKSEEFADKILEKYNREDLREVSPSYALPGTMTYAQKLSVAMTNSDFLVLTQSEFQVYEKTFATYFVEVTPYIQEKCQIQDDQIVSKYGISLKKSNETHYLEQYMTFKAEEDYVLAFSTSSKNLGAAMNEDNAPYDNALTFVHYLIEGVK